MIFEKNQIFCNMLVVPACWKPFTACKVASYSRIVLDWNVNELESKWRTWNNLMSEIWQLQMFWILILSDKAQYYMKLSSFSPFSPLCPLFFLTFSSSIFASKCRFYIHNGTSNTRLLFGLWNKIVFWFLFFSSLRHSDFKSWVKLKK